MELVGYLILFLVMIDKILLLQLDINIINGIIIKNVENSICGILYEVMMTLNFVDYPKKIYTNKIKICSEHNRIERKQMRDHINTVLSALTKKIKSTDNLSENKLLLIYAETPRLFLNRRDNRKIHFVRKELRNIVSLPIHRNNFDSNIIFLNGLTMALAIEFIEKSFIYEKDYVLKDIMSLKFHPEYLSITFKTTYLNNYLLQQYIQNTTVFGKDYSIFSYSSVCSTPDTYKILIHFEIINYFSGVLVRNPHHVLLNPCDNEGSYSFKAPKKFEYCIDEKFKQINKENTYNFYGVFNYEACNKIMHMVIQREKVTKDSTLYIEHLLAMMTNLNITTKKIISIDVFLSNLYSYKNPDPLKIMEFEKLLCSVPGISKNYKLLHMCYVGIFLKYHILRFITSLNIDKTYFKQIDEEEDVEWIFDPRLSKYLFFNSSKYYPIIDKKSYNHHYYHIGVNNIFKDFAYTKKLIIITVIAVSIHFFIFIICCYIIRNICRNITICFC